MTCLCFWFYINTLWLWIYQDQGGAEADPYSNGGWDSDEDLLDYKGPNPHIPGEVFPFPLDYFTDSDSD